MTKVYAIEGLDRLGKSTLIEGIQQRLGHFQVVHFGKPHRLKIYEDAKLPQFETRHAPAGSYPEYLYQRESFLNSMIMALSGARIIFDRWHLGEAVYGPLYRGYGADYIFEMERIMHLHMVTDIRLILLVEDFEVSSHFETDGDSFDDMKRRDEQELFLAAFQRSCIQDKRVICVTGLNGAFRPRQEILEEAMA